MPLLAEIPGKLTVALFTIMVPFITEIFNAAPSKEVKCVTAISSLELYNPLTTWYSRTFFNSDLPVGLRKMSKADCPSFANALSEGANTVNGPGPDTVVDSPEERIAVYKFEDWFLMI